MSPGDGERRPHNTDGAPNPDNDDEFNFTLASARCAAEPRDRDLAEVEPRAGGTVRVTTNRTVAARCSTCNARFNNTGAAAAHARGARHVVQVDYRTAFAFLPSELVGGGRRA
jgi:hypothetical protein